MNDMSWMPISEPPEMKKPAVGKYVNLSAAYDMATLEDWYINSVSDEDTSKWTDEHLEELMNDFYLIPKDALTVDIYNEQ